MQEVFPFSQNSATEVSCCILWAIHNPETHKSTRSCCAGNSSATMVTSCSRETDHILSLKPQAASFDRFYYFILSVVMYGVFLQTLLLHTSFIFLRTNYFLAPFRKISKYPVDLKQRKQSARVLNMLRLLLKPIHQLNCLQGGYSYTGLVCDRNLRPTAHTVEQQYEATNPIGSHPKIHLYQRESPLWFQWPLAQASNH